jgi:hypothetical protein
MVVQGLYIGRIGAVVRWYFCKANLIYQEVFEVEGEIL